jgi:hypothetical protein
MRLIALLSVRAAFTHRRESASLLPGPSLRAYSDARGAGHTLFVLLEEDSKENCKENMITR